MATPVPGFSSLSSWVQKMRREDSSLKELEEKNDPSYAAQGRFLDLVTIERVVPLQKIENPLPCSKTPTSHTTSSKSDGDFEKGRKASPIPIAPWMVKQKPMSQHFSPNFLDKSAKEEGNIHAFQASITNASDLSENSSFSSMASSTRTMNMSAPHALIKEALGKEEGFVQARYHPSSKKDSLVSEPSIAHTQASPITEADKKSPVSIIHHSHDKQTPMNEEKNQHGQNALSMNHSSSHIGRKIKNKSLAEGKNGLINSQVSSHTLTDMTSYGEALGKNRLNYASSLKPPIVQHFSSSVLGGAEGIKGSKTPTLEKTQNPFHEKFHNALHDKVKEIQKIMNQQKLVKGTSEFQMTLKPDLMDDVKVSIDMSRDHVQATFVASNRDDLAALAQAREVIQNVFEQCDFHQNQQDLSFFMNQQNQQQQNKKEREGSFSFRGDSPLGENFSHTPTTQTPSRPLSSNAYGYTKAGSVIA